MTRALVSWPKAYIIELYSSAVEHGFIWIGPITQANATSLSKSFYNARRRSSSDNSSTWFRQEYHLCTFGQWEQQGDDPTLGRIPLLFSALPDGQALPTITPGNPSEVARNKVQLPEPAEDAPAELPEALASSIRLEPDFDISQFVKNMKDKIAEE